MNSKFLIGQVDGGSFQCGAAVGLGATCGARPRNK